MKLEKDYEEPVLSWQADPTPENADRMLHSLNPLITSATKSHVGDANPLIRSQARRMTLDAMQRYDPQQSSVRTHLYNQLQGLKRVNRQQTRAISAPERVVLDQGRLREHINTFQTEYGRDPTDEELADASHMSVKRIRHVRKFRAGVPEGAFQNEQGEVTLPESSRPGSPPSGNAWVEIVYDDMEPTNQLIMEHSLGLHGKPVLSNERLAKMLRITPGAVSQRKLHIQKQLDQEDLYSPF